MTSPSPSDFLTFSRRTLAPAFRTLTHTRTNASFAQIQPRTARFLSSSSGSLRGEGKANNREHVLDRQKNERLDPQAKQSGIAQEERQAKNGGSSATQERDSNNSTKKARKDFPNAPKTIIGMQDERGGKGH